MATFAAMVVPRMGAAFRRSGGGCRDALWVVLRMLDPPEHRSDGAGRACPTQLGNGIPSRAKVR
jgi:hypothetical protein